MSWLPICAGLLVFAMRMAELRTQRETIRGAIQERWTLRIFILSGTLLFGGALAEFYWKGFYWNPIALAMGLVLAFISIALRAQARSALGKFWSLHNEIRPNQQFVQAGAFKYVRHPTYLSMILELASGAFIFCAPIAFLAVSVCFFPTLWFRIRKEEAALIETLGQPYREYRSRTPALIPGWKRKSHA
jgi:protein-S-isoprenylcysteine O-methyltransferase Ste14